MTFLARTSLAVATLAAALLTGCSSGSTVMVSGSKPATALPVEQVRLYTQAPQSGYEVVALISASANVGNYLSVDRAEAAALDRLKEAAAEAGANGVVEIQRETVENGTITSTSAWGRGSQVQWRDGITTAHAEVGTRTSTYVSRTIVFRAKAIRGGAPVATHTSTASASTYATGSATRTSASTRRRR